MRWLRIVKAGFERLDEIEPLWQALSEHHAAIAPDNGEPRPEGESWRRRRVQYEGWLADPDSFLLIAESDGAPIGYALVRTRPGSATWEGSERVGEVETLVVLPGERGRGVGGALLDRVCEKLARLGIGELTLHVLPENEAAIEFYRRRGFRTFSLWLSADVATVQNAWSANVDSVVYGNP